MRQHDTGLCFMCKDQQETQQHMFECRCEIIKDRRERLALESRNKMEQMGTPHEVAAFFMRAILQPEEATSYQGKLDRLSRSISWAVEKAIVSQSRIGWGNLRKGFLSKYWRNVAKLTAHQTDTKFEPIDWEMKIIRIIFKFNNDLWKERCALLHPGQESYLAYMRRTATDTLVFLKQRKNRHLIGLYRSVIRYPWNHFSKASRVTILFWLDSIQNALSYTQAHHKKTQPLITEWAKPVTGTGRGSASKLCPERVKVLDRVKTMRRRTPFEVARCAGDVDNIDDDSFSEVFLFE